MTKGEAIERIQELEDALENAKDLINEVLGLDDTDDEETEE